MSEYSWALFLHLLGVVVLAGGIVAQVTDLGVHERTALGMGRTFQNVGMVKTATALENLKTAQHARTPYLLVEGLLDGFERGPRHA